MKCMFSWAVIVWISFDKSQAVLAMGTMGKTAGSEDR